MYYNYTSNKWVTYHYITGRKTDFISFVTVKIIQCSAHNVVTTWTSPISNNRAYDNSQSSDISGQTKFDQTNLLYIINGEVDECITGKPYHNKHCSQCNHKWTICTGLIPKLKYSINTGRLIIMYACVYFLHFVPHCRGAFHWGANIVHIHIRTYIS